MCTCLLDGNFLLSNSDLLFEIQVCLPSETISFVLPALFLFHSVSVFSNSFIVEVTIIFDNADPDLIITHLDSLCGDDIGTLGFLFPFPEWKLVHRHGGQCIVCCTYLYCSFIAIRNISPKL